MIIANTLYPLVIVEEKINKKSIYIWQKLEYTINYTGDADKFKAEGINTNAISDFEVINEKVEIETVHKENEIPTMSCKIIYTMKPVRSGKLKIPELEARYYNVESGNSLVPKEQMIGGYNIRVFNSWFILIMVGQWVIIIFIAFLIYKFIRDQYKFNKKNFENKNKE
ncbi:BatD family protein [Brachyspira sp.]|uniref:BatD family protein n=1 Tax=Brachyspira sp. TaxID=1977261 RepID=UPI0026304F34|nr:BatD family protein [Brachyspira sp.]